MIEIIRLFPPLFQQKIEKAVGNNWSRLQEIRVRVNQNIELIFATGVRWLDKPVPAKKDTAYMLNQLSEYSLYRMEEELRNGFITVQGGHRVGLAGEITTAEGRVKAIQTVSFLNIRIAKQHKGIADKLLPYIYDGGYHNTIILGAPQSGKTTVIRDICRQIAAAYPSPRSKKIAVIDERSEIAASIQGVPQHDVGRRTDVLDACPKAEGMMMAIRSMSPDIVVVDEIGSEADAKAVLEAAQAGVQIICTAHANKMTDLYRRPSLRKLLDNEIFDRFLFLGQGKNLGKLTEAFDGEGKRIPDKKRGGELEMDWRSAFN